MEGSDRYLVMKLLRGKSLESMLQDYGRLQWRLATILILHVSRALAHLASRGIVHRDVKPENIFITSPTADGGGLVHSSCNGAAVIGLPSSSLAAVLIDLGLACRVADLDPPPPPAAPALRRAVAPSAGSATKLGDPLGSGFCAPEQVHDARTAHYSADVYSLGATWHAAVMGKLTGEGSYTSVHARAPDVPPAIRAMMDWMLHKDPDARPASGDALVAHIEAVLRSPFDAHAVRSARQAHERRRRRADLRSCAARNVAGTIGLMLFTWLLWITLELRDPVPDPIGQL